MELKQFDERVLNFQGISIVDFWAEWCAPCKQYGPIVEEVKQQFSDNERVDIVKVNVDESVELTRNYNVLSIPTTIIFKDGVEVIRKEGIVTKDSLVNRINELL